ncbi:MAG: CGNR zinc finger domain-containing protein [Janthinobacterium lividum]
MPGLRPPRPEPVFVGDHLATDFLNSIENPTIPNADWLSDGDGLLGWLARAGVVDVSVLAAMRELPPDRLDAVAADAVALREWLRSLLREQAGRPFTAEDLPKLEPLNRRLVEDRRADRILAAEPHGDDRPRHLRIGRGEDWSDPRQLLQPIVRAGAELICQEDQSLVRTCGGPTCTLMFLDRTKSHRRRWCSMAICGNRAKVSTHRARVAGKAP